MFYPFFRKELLMMSSKYDLYFIHETMRKVMHVYKDGIGEVNIYTFSDPPTLCWWVRNDVIMTS